MIFRSEGFRFRQTAHLVETSNLQSRVHFFSSENQINMSDCGDNCSSGYIITVVMLSSMLIFLAGFMGYSIYSIWKDGSDKKQDPK
jgi:hypothetical protein